MYVFTIIFQNMLPVSFNSVYGYVIELKAG